MVKRVPLVDLIADIRWGFCVNCVLSARGQLFHGQLVTTPTTCFTRAKQTLQEHNVQATYRVAMEDSAVYIGQMEDGHSSVEQQSQTQAFDVIQRNRAILRSILKAARFCGRQNIAAVYDLYTYNKPGDVVR